MRSSRLQRPRQPPSSSRPQRGVTSGRPGNRTITVSPLRLPGQERRRLLTISGLRREYEAGTRTPADVIDSIFRRIETDGSRPVWISLGDRAATVEKASRTDLSLPLAGVPFAVKDNIDVEGMMTTAACPSFGYVASRSAVVVERLVAAGAIVIGKTNMDQFATGLVGTRSPYGECACVFDPQYISGGSSSGSAVAVAQGLSAFSLGTDTAGSGRVPAAFNNLVGLKPTRGAISSTGVVPACRSLDCVSVFATSAADADTVWRIATAPDHRDPYSRTFDAAESAAPWLGGPFRFGIPADSELEFFGDGAAAELYWCAVQQLEALGGTRVTIDYRPFQDAASLLYGGPWVAERFAAVGGFLASNPADANPIVAEIIERGAHVSATDAFRGAYTLAHLRSQVSSMWQDVDVLMLPTTGTIYRREAVRLDPVRLNTNLGYYTNFVNLLDLAAIAIPAGFRPNGLPFGVSLVGPAFSDPALLALAGCFLDEPGALPRTRPGCIHLAVVGAHLAGQPLNHQLTDCGARLVDTTRTASDYRLFALTGTMPAKPGLVRGADAAGSGIEVEIWAVPGREFGAFVRGVSAPLAIGNIQLASGEWVKGFVCEPWALADAVEITSFGGWRRYLDATATGAAPAAHGA